MSSENRAKMPEWCMYCKWHAWENNNRVCMYGSWLTLLLRGPERVPYNAWCNRFQFHEQYKSKVK